MFEPTRTTTALLEGLHNPADALAWEQFDRRYRPVVVGFASRLGLADADAADVAQEAMLQFVKEFRAGRYDRERGRLRTWLISLTKSKVAALRRSRQRRVGERGESAMIELPNEPELREMWEAERRVHMMREALDEVQHRSRFSEKSLRAFDLLVVRETPAAAVAEQLAMTVHDVYQAKSRIAGRLREVLSSLEVCFDDERPLPVSGKLGAQRGDFRDE